MMWKTVFNESIKTLLNLADKVSNFLFVFFLVFLWFLLLWFFNEPVGTTIFSFVRLFWITFSHQSVASFSWNVSWRCSMKRLWKSDMEVFSEIFSPDNIRKLHDIFVFLLTFCHWWFSHFIPNFAQNLNRWLQCFFIWKSGNDVCCTLLKVCISG